MADGLLRGGEFEILQADLVLSTGKVVGLKASIKVLIACLWLIVAFVTIVSTMLGFLALASE